MREMLPQGWNHQDQASLKALPCTVQRQKHRREVKSHGSKLSASSSESLDICQTHEYSSTDFIIRLAFMQFPHCKWPFTCKVHEASCSFSFRQFVTIGNDNEGTLKLSLFFHACFFCLLYLGLRADIVLSIVFFLFKIGPSFF